MFNLKFVVSNIDKEVQLKSEKNCIVLVGEVGSGKTSICERYLDYSGTITNDPFMLHKYASAVIDNNIAKEKFKEYVTPFIEKVETISVDGLYVKLDNKELAYYSSGQKKIISLFITICYVLYCIDKVNLSLIVDDIDSNLSIEYQKMLSEILSKIIEENPQHNFLFTTHSPFIFENLVQYTVDISTLLVKDVPYEHF